MASHAAPSGPGFVALAASCLEASIDQVQRLSPVVRLGGRKEFEALVHDQLWPTSCTAGDHPVSHRLTIGWGLPSFARPLLTPANHAGECQAQRSGPDRN